MISIHLWKSIHNIYNALKFGPKAHIYNWVWVSDLQIFSISGLINCHREHSCPGAESRGSINNKENTIYQQPTNSWENCGHRCFCGSESIIEDPVRARGQGVDGEAQWFVVRIQCHQCIMQILLCFGGIWEDMLTLKLKQKINLISTPGKDEVCDELETATEAELLLLAATRAWGFCGSGWIVASLAEIMVDLLLGS